MASNLDSPREKDGRQMSRRARIAFLLDSFSIGGTELNAVRTAEALVGRGHSLYVVHLRGDGPLRSRYERLGVPLRHIPIRNLYEPRTLIQGYRLARQLRDWDVDLAHSHDVYNNIFAVPWARWGARCAVVASRRWEAEIPRPQLASANRWSYRFADAVVGNSAAIGRLLREKDGVPSRRVIVIRNFVAPGAWEPMSPERIASYRRAWNVPPGGFVVGLVARLFDVKNHELAIDAMRYLADGARLVLIGDGPERARLERLARTAGVADRVHFAGEQVTGENLNWCFDVSVLCSRSEGFPNVVLEAMAARRPVVATPVGGVVEIVRDGATGLLTAVDDPPALARRLDELRADASLRARIAESGWSAVRAEYSREAAIGALEALYADLIRSRHATGNGSDQDRRHPRG